MYDDEYFVLERGEDNNLALDKMYRLTINFAL